MIILKSNDSADEVARSHQKFWAEQYEAVPIAVA